MPIRVFGLTGGIGSGKSVVAARFRARHLPVLDADQLARQAVAPGSAGLAEIVACFGAQALAADGTLDRQRIAEIVFNDDSARTRLDAITHPLIRNLAAEQQRELDQSGQPLACYEAALLVENNLADRFRPLVVVTASTPVCLHRVMARDSSTQEQVLARVRAQLPISEKAQLADHVIDNDGPLATTQAQADAVLGAICEQLGVAVERYPVPAPG